MAYGHAERNLALIRQLEAETARLLGSLDRSDASRQPAHMGETRELPLGVSAELVKAGPDK